MPVKKHDGKVHDQDADRGDENRERQFRCAVFRSRAPVLAHFKVTMQVLLHHDIVVQ